MNCRSEYTANRELQRGQNATWYPGMRPVRRRLSGNPPAAPNRIIWVLLAIAGAIVAAVLS